MHANPDVRFEPLIESLLRHRRAGTKLPGDALPLLPDDLDTAYAVQHAATARWPDKLAGWKVGATSRELQKLFGIDAPIYGAVFAPTVHASPARLPARDWRHRLIESELAFRLGRTLAPRPGGYGRQDIVAAIDAVVPAIEIIDMRFDRLMPEKIVAFTADWCGNGGAVLGRPVTDWRALDLVGLPVALSIGGAVRQRGTGATTLGDPLSVLDWFVNQASTHGITLEAGQLILAGTMTGLHAPDIGSAAVADYGPLGTVEVVFA